MDDSIPSHPEVDANRRAFMKSFGTLSLAALGTTEALATPQGCRLAGTLDRLPRFDLRQVSFSTAGAAFTLSALDEEIWKSAGYKGAPSLSVRTLRGEPPLAGAPEGLQGRVIDLVPVGDYSIEATPETLTIRGANGGCITMRYLDRLTLRMEGDGLGLRLTTPGIPVQTVVQETRDRVRWNSISAACVLHIERHAGAMKVVAPWNGTTSTSVDISLSEGAWIVDIVEVEWRNAPLPAVLPGYREFEKAMPNMPSRYSEARALAAYVNWSALVAPNDRFKRPAMLMSNNWMNAVWSWDHCFNAIALSRGLPDLAWDQLQLPFDLMTIEGQLPDRIQDRTLVWNFVKPPIHGWALMRIMELTALPLAKLRDFYPKLALATQWWLGDANKSAAGLPVYHHGNDSGWDNSTAFKADMPLEAPDLAAFLILQMDALALLAARIGDHAAAERWQTRSRALLQLLLRELWRDDHFVARSASTGAVHTTSDSLVTIMPLVLGKSLPESIRRRLIASLADEGRFLCPSGIASESLRSREYEPDGYWRGPVWAPTSFLLTDVLARLGEIRLAATIARRFCDTCLNSGFAENFEATNGRPLRDPSYTWTSSVFLAMSRFLGDARPFTPMAGVPLAEGGR
jgi:putative isomerase